MVDAALIGDGFERMAELAAEEAGRGVAIVVPLIDVAVLWPGGQTTSSTRSSVSPLRADGAKRSRSRPAFELIVPVTFGEKLVGSVAMLAGDGPAPAEASEFLHLAATARRPRSRSRRRASVDADPGGLISDVLAERALEARRPRAGGRVRCDPTWRGLAASATEMLSTRPRRRRGRGRGVPGALAELSATVSTPSAGERRGQKPRGAPRRVRADRLLLVLCRADDLPVRYAKQS